MAHSAQPSPPRGGDEELDDLVEALLTASRVLVGISARSLAGLEDSVTLAQFRTVVVLDAAGELSLNQLAEVLDVNSSSAVRMIDRLLAAGLVTRRENPDNRRQVILAVTPAGRDMVQRVTLRRRREIAGIVARMEPGSRTDLVAALRAFSGATEDGSAVGREAGRLGW